MLLGTREKVETARGEKDREELTVIKRNATAYASLHAWNDVTKCSVPRGRGDRNHEKHCLRGLCHMSVAVGQWKTDQSVRLMR